MGHLDIVNILLFWGCYADGIDCEGRTVLSVAAAEGSAGVVQVGETRYGRDSLSKYLKSLENLKKILNYFIEELSSLMKLFIVCKNVYSIRSLLFLVSSRRHS